MCHINGVYLLTYLLFISLVYNARYYLSYIPRISREILGKIICKSLGVDLYPGQVIKQKKTALEHVQNGNNPIYYYYYYKQLINVQQKSTI